MWLSINPNAVSEAAKTIACEILIADQDRFVEAEDVETITPTALARAYNVVDPEVTGLATAKEEQWKRIDALADDFSAALGG
jgi:hypothetical protein